MNALLGPAFTPHTQDVYRTACGALTLAFLGFTAFQVRRFFVSDRWRGYAKSGPLTDVLQNPVTAWVWWALWMLCGLGLLLGRETVAAAGVNLVFSRYFFIHMRWKGVLRGGGAPGFMTYWLAASCFFLELGRHGDPSGRLLPVALYAFKADFAFIMLSAGVYKLLSGYAQNNGMEFGIYNPFWGYWGRLYRGMRHDHWILKTLNHLAWSLEVIAGILMLIPAAQLWGAALMFGSFAWIATHIRLGVLCEMVMLACALYIGAGDVVDRWLASSVAAPASVNTLAGRLPAWGVAALLVFFWAYAGLLPLAHFGLYFNFLAKMRFPAPIQWALERWTNLFGIIIWRVFTIDVVNFYVRIYVEDAGGRREEYTEFRRPSWRSRFRYWHVSEFVALTSVFTTLKYYSSNRVLFEERLLRYARTIPCPAGSVLVFRYLSLRKTPKGFEEIPAAEFRVDPEARTIAQTTLAPEIDVLAAHPGSPVHEGKTPGSYAPSGR